jgi:hypothetical protein
MKTFTFNTTYTTYKINIDHTKLEIEEGSSTVCYGDFICQKTYPVKTLPDVYTSEELKEVKRLFKHVCLDQGLATIYQLAFKYNKITGFLIISPDYRSAEYITIIDNNIESQMGNLS